MIRREPNQQLPGAGDFSEDVLNSPQQSEDRKDEHSHKTFGGFLRNIAKSIRNHSRSQNSSENHGGCLSFLSTLFGGRSQRNSSRQGNNEEERQDQELTREPKPESRPEQRQERRQNFRSDTRQEPRRVRVQTRVENVGNRAARESAREMRPARRVHSPEIHPLMQTENENSLMSRARPENNTIFRTIELGPSGTVIIRSRMVPPDPLQILQGPSGQPIGLPSLGPMGMLLSMMSSNFPELLMAASNLQERGLDKSILNSMPIVRYNEMANKNVEEEAKKCPICLEEFQEDQEARYLWCMHRFHRECVDQWLANHTNCPICKKDFSEVENSYN